jgi:hypothetical protein
LECGDPAPLLHGVADCSHEARMKPCASDVKGKAAPDRRTPKFLKTSMKDNLLFICAMWQGVINILW